MFNPFDESGCQHASPKHAKNTIQHEAKKLPSW